MADYLITCVNKPNRLSPHEHICVARADLKAFCSAGTLHPPRASRDHLRQGLRYPSIKVFVPPLRRSQGALAP